MRRTKDILRLRFESGLGLRQIARSLSISAGTVHDYLQRAESAGIKWPLPEGLDDSHLEAALFRQPTASAPPQKVPPDYAAIHQQLQKPHVTLQLLWEEYQETNPDGYRYSRFCELYQRWRRKQDVVLRQQHKPGERMFVDWAGATIPIHNRSTGEITQAPLFVATLGVSSCTYAEVARNQQLDSWIQVNMHALEFYGGVPQLSVPDNTKTGVTKACRYDPDLNATYQEFAMHYGMGVLPTRPYKPRDKAKVESGVQLVQRWIVAALRRHRSYTVDEANQAIRPLLVRLNARSFRKRDGSRTSVFQEVDRPALRPLPAERFDMSQWSHARVNIDYHVAFDSNFYSVPYNLVHELIDVRSLPTTVEIFHKSARVASHLRSHGRGQVVTNPEHRPKSHQAHLEWTPLRMVNWARTIGADTARLFERILEDKPHPEMGYRACLGIIRLADVYTAARMESAAQLALATGACRYQSIKSILKNSLDLAPSPQVETPPAVTPPLHDNIRGASYFDGEVG